MISVWKNAPALGLVLLVGCGAKSDPSSPNTSPASVVTAAPMEDGPQVDHPEFACWSRFPVGTVVVRTKEVSSDSETLRVTTTLRLAEKTTDKVVVENQITVERPGQSATQNPALKLEFPASFRLPPGMRLEQFTLPSLQAQHLGEETRQACGQDFNAQLFIWDEVNETGRMTVKLWRTDDIPGRMLRQEITGPNHTSIEEVVAISK